MPTYRDEIAGNDVITSKRLFGFIWRRIARASSKLNSIKQKASKQTNELLKTLAELEAEERTFNVKVKEMKRQAFNGLGEGKPYTLSSKDAAKRFAVLTDPPDPSWMDVINPIVLRRYNISAEGGGGQAKSPEKGVAPVLRGTRTAYTTAGNEHAALHLAGESGAQQVLAFKNSEGKKGGSNDLKAQIKADNPRESGESDAEYGKRISRLIREHQQDKSD